MGISEQGMETDVEGECVLEIEVAYVGRSYVPGLGLG